MRRCFLTEMLQTSFFLVDSYLFRNRDSRFMPGGREILFYINVRKNYFRAEQSEKKARRRKFVQTPGESLYVAVHSLNLHLQAALKRSVS